MRLARSAALRNNHGYQSLVFTSSQHYHLVQSFKFPRLSLHTKRFMNPYSRRPSRPTFLFPCTVPSVMETDNRAEPSERNAAVFGVRSVAMLLYYNNPSSIHEMRVIVVINHSPAETTSPPLRLPSRSQIRILRICEMRWTLIFRLGSRYECGFGDGLWGGTRERLSRMGSQGGNEDLWLPETHGG